MDEILLPEINAGESELATRKEVIMRKILHIGVALSVADATLTYEATDALAEKADAYRDQLIDEANELFDADELKRIDDDLHAHANRLICDWIREAMPEGEI